jgi:hypothetical protein
MGILDLLTGGGLGAIAGAIGAIGSKVVDLKMKDKETEQLKINNEQALAMRDKDLALSIEEAKNRFEMAKVDADTKKVSEDLGAMTASFANDKATYDNSKWGWLIDFVRGSTRPVITYFAMWLVIFMTVRVLATLGDHPLTNEQNMEILRQVLFLAGVAIGWWFGARPSTSAKG